VVSNAATEKRVYELKNMSEPHIAQKAPYPVSVVAGKTYYWCSCGQSKNQPLCDGSHKGSEFTPKPYTAEKDGTVYFCGCKHSGQGTLCDGSHSKL
jgi:CDGSH-type Zn-finger protein